MAAAAAVLDPAIHPHLFETILSSLLPSDMMSLRAVSSAFLSATDTFLAQHIRLFPSHPSIPGLQSLPFFYALFRKSDKLLPEPAPFSRCVAALQSTRAVTICGPIGRLSPDIHSMILPALQGIQVVRAQEATFIPLVAPTLAAFTIFKMRELKPSEFPAPHNPLWRPCMLAPVPFVYQGTIKLVVNVKLPASWALGVSFCSVDAFNHPPSLTRVVIIFHRHGGGQGFVTLPPRSKFPSVHQKPALIGTSPDPGLPKPRLLDNVIANALAPLLRGVKYTFVDVDTWLPEWLNATSKDDYDGATKLGLQERLVRAVGRCGSAQGWTQTQVLTAQSNIEFVSRAQYRAEVGEHLFEYETSLSCASWYEV